MRLIQAFNDHYYRGPAPAIYTKKSTPQLEEYAFIVQIIDSFIAYAKWETLTAKLLKAELYREAGMFDQCKETLDAIDYRQLDSYIRNIYDGIKKRMKAKVTKVFRIGKE